MGAAYGGHEHWDGMKMASKANQQLGRTIQPEQKTEFKRINAPGVIEAEFVEVEE